MMHTMWRNIVDFTLHKNMKFYELHKTLCNFSCNCLQQSLAGTNPKSHSKLSSTKKDRINEIKISNLID